MKLSIETEELEDRTGYIAAVSWNHDDAAEGKGYTPGAISFGDTHEQAFKSLKEILERKGHVINKHIKL